MIQQTSRWASASPCTNHATLKGHSQRQIVETQLPPSIARLQPGESMTYSTTVAEPKVSWTQDDRLEFCNGGTIEDKPKEGGLLITSAEGKAHEVPGWIEMDYEAQQPKVFFKSYDREQDEWVTWEQSFPAAGGTTVERSPDRSDEPQRLIHVQSDGRVQVEATDWEASPVQLNSSLQGQAIVMEGSGQGEALVPAVPLEWVLSR